jgi:hypothetical protein
MKAHCEDKDHQPWPAQGRHTRHASSTSSQERSAAFDRDVATLTAEAETSSAVPGTPRLHLIDGLRVDIDTGEVSD